MLQHIHSESEGTVGNVVTITSRTISRFRLDETCYSGIMFGGDGILYAIQNNTGTSAIIGEWLVNGTPGDFYVSRTIISDTLDTDAGAGPLQLNAGRLYRINRSMIGVKTTVITCDISDDVSGSPILDSATFTFVAEYETSN